MLAPMLADAEIAALRRRWQGILVHVHDGLALHGIDARDVLITSTPLRLQIGAYAEVLLAEGPGQPQAQIRALRPGDGVLVADLDRLDAEVTADILDCIGVLHWRRQRRIDADRAAIEAEMADMVASTGWVCCGVGGRQPQAVFRSADDSIRGGVVRCDRGDGDPAAARFTITVEVGGLRYADALASLAEMRRACLSWEPRCENGGERRACGRSACDHRSLSSQSASGFELLGDPLGSAAATRACASSCS